MTPNRTSRSKQERFERLLAKALTSQDPVAALKRAARDPRLPTKVRKVMRQANSDGVRMSGLLVARLRFERLLRGSRDAARWYRADAASFTKAFRVYHHAVLPTAFFPQPEARLFREWLANASF